MNGFLNATLEAIPPPSTPASSAMDMENIHDSEASAGSGRFYYGGPSYYGNQYGGNRLRTIGEVAVAVVLVGVVFLVIYWILALFARMQQRHYYGIRKKRSAHAADVSDTDLFFMGGSAGIHDVESWRRGRDDLIKMMKNNAGESELDMTARIVDSIEKRGLDYD